MKSSKKKLQNKIFFWALIVIAVNLIQYLFHNSVTVGISLVITVYALYAITIKEKVETKK